MTQSNNNIITIGGVKNDGKSTLGLFYLEKNSKPSIVIDITEQFEANRKYKKIVRGVQALKYELSDDKSLKVFKKGKMQLIFRPTTNDITKEIEEVVDFIMSNNFQNIAILFDEIEVYANNKLTNKSPLFKLFYISRNRKIDIISIVKIFGLLSPLIKSQTDYFALSQIDDINSQKYLDSRSFKRFSDEIQDIKQHEFLVTDLKKYWSKIKLEKSIVRLIS
jgi:hypothetical protein